MTKIISLFAVFIFSILVSLSQPSIAWQKCLGGSHSELANTILQTNDGGYILAGYSGSSDGDVTNNHGIFDYWIVKLDDNGNIQWQESFGGSEIDIATSILQLSDSSYIVAGHTYSQNGDVSNNHGLFTSDFWIVKLDINGNLEWEESYGGSMFEFAQEIIETHDGGYLVAGVSSSNDGDVTVNKGSMDYWIVKIDMNESLQWQKSYGGSGNDGVYSAKQTNDNGFIIAGYTDSQDGDVSNAYGAYDYWIIKTDSVGNLQWEKTLGGTATDIAHCVELTADGGYIIAGASSSNDFDVTGNNGFSDFWIVKLDAGGNLQWQKALGGSNFDEAKSISPTSDGGYVVTGRAKSNDGDLTINNGDFDYWIVKLDANGSIEWQKSLGGSGSDVAYSIIQTNDYGYILAGQSNSNNGDVTCNNGGVNIWIVKLNAVVSVNEFNSENGFTIYPNPATSVLNIKGLLTDHENYSYKIYSIYGRLVQSGKLTETTNVSELSSGVYFIKMFDNSASAFFKFVKQ